VQSFVCPRKQSVKISPIRARCKDISSAFYKHTHTYRAFLRFGQAKFAYDDSILGFGQFAQLHQLPLKMMLDLKVVKIDLLH